MAPLDQNYYSELIVYLLINEPSDDFQAGGIEIRCREFIIANDTCH